MPPRHPPALPFKRGRARLCPAPTRPLLPPPQGHPEPAPALPEGGAAAAGFSRNAGGNGAGGGGAAAGGSSAARARPARGIVGRKVVGAAEEAAGGDGGGERSAAESPRANGGRAGPARRVGVVPLSAAANAVSARVCPCVRPCVSVCPGPPAAAAPCNGPRETPRPPCLFAPCPSPTALPRDLWDLQIIPGGFFLPPHPPASPAPNLRFLSRRLTGELRRRRQRGAGQTPHTKVPAPIALPPAAARGDCPVSPEPWNRQLPLAAGSGGQRGVTRTAPQLSPRAPHLRPAAKGKAGAIPLASPSQ